MARARLCSLALTADPNLGLSFDGVVAVFDVTNSATLASAAAQSTLCSRRRHTADFGGHKVRQGRVTPAEGEDVAQRHGMRYFEVSASTGAGVQKAFDAIIRLARLALTAKLDLCTVTMIHQTSGFWARVAEAHSAANARCCLV